MRTTLKFKGLCSETNGVVLSSENFCCILGLQHSSTCSVLMFNLHIQMFLISKELFPMQAWKLLEHWILHACGVHCEILAPLLWRVSNMFLYNAMCPMGWNPSLGSKWQLLFCESHFVGQWCIKLVLLLVVVGYFFPSERLCCIFGIMPFTSMPSS